jgi:hypothetical protein
MARRIRRTLSLWLLDLCPACGRLRPIWHAHQHLTPEQRDFLDSIERGAR